MYHVIASVFLIHQTFSTNPYCYDYEECEGETIDYHEVWCNGYDSCKSSSITAGVNAYCNGYQGCIGSSYINAVNTVECYGYDSCVSVNEIVSENDIECDGMNGCEKADSITANTVSCGAYMSCRQVDTIIAHEMLKAYGQVSLWDVSSVSTAWLHCVGVMACYQIDIISAPLVTSYGQQSLQDSIVDSDGLSALEVKSKGHYSGLYSSIYCRSGTDNCTITCFGSGCYELYVYYEGSLSQIIVDPPACKLPNNRGNQIAGKSWATWCPYIESADDMTQDEFEEMKKERMRNVEEDDVVQRELVHVNDLLKRKDNEPKELRQFKEESISVLGDEETQRFSYNVWIIAVVLGMFMIFVCYFAYKKNKEYEMI